MARRVAAALPQLHPCQPRRSRFSNAGSGLRDARESTTFEKSLRFDPRETTNLQERPGIAESVDRVGVVEARHGRQQPVKVLTSGRTVRAAHRNRYSDAAKPGVLASSVRDKYRLRPPRCGRESPATLKRDAAHSSSSSAVCSSCSANSAWPACAIAAAASSIPSGFSPSALTMFAPSIVAQCSQADACQPPVSPSVDCRRSFKASR